MRDWSLKSGVVIATAKVATKARLSFFNGAPTSYNIATALTMYTTRLVDVVQVSSK